jgi:hypothetical protein
MQIYEVDTNTGNAVEQLIEGVRYTPEGRGVRFPMGSLGLLLT